MGTCSSSCRTLSLPPFPPLVPPAQGGGKQQAVRVSCSLLSWNRGTLDPAFRTPLLLRPTGRPAEQGLCARLCGEQFWGPCLASAADLSQHPHPGPVGSGSECSLCGPRLLGLQPGTQSSSAGSPASSSPAMGTQPGGQGLRESSSQVSVPQGETANAPHSSLTQRTVPFAGTQGHPTPHWFGFSWKDCDTCSRAAARISAPRQQAFPASTSSR